ncbi:MAG TPA: undecaprenyl-phosphate galactose phosphotransferase WbaP [Tepidisphaeraceae bacterium]
MMSTSYELDQAIGLELDPLEETPFSVTATATATATADLPLETPVPEPIFARIYQAGIDPERAALWQGEIRSAAQAGTIARQARRCARTILPLVLADVLALVAAGLIAQWVVLGIAQGMGTLTGSLTPLALLPLPIVYALSDLYSEIWAHPVVEFRQLTRINTALLLAAAVGGLWSSSPLPAWCVTAWAGAVILVPLARTLARFCCSNRAWWGYPTLVIGSGNGAPQLAQMLLECPRCGLRPVLVTDPAGSCRSGALPVVNDPTTLESLVRLKGIRHAVVSLPEVSLARMGQTLDRYSGLVPHLLVLSDASTLPTLWGASRSCGRLSGIEVRNGLLMATLQGFKRLIDVAVAAAALLVSLPLLVAIALALKLTSRGPVFYGQRRIGRHGRCFKAWKFRTMRPDGDTVLAELLRGNPVARAEWERDHKLRHDPRVTRLGRFLRRTSLDELPQVWNVLRGDMSIVGPRPIVESEVRRYGEVFRLYTTVKPGITGLWQVAGRTNLSYDDRVLLDQFYIRHWSPWVDVYILAKTVVALVNREGAY